MRWTVKRADVRCGNCPRVIAAGEPVALLTAKELERCETCAGGDVDHAQVDAARHAIETEDAARAAAPVPVILTNRRAQDTFLPLGEIRMPAPTPTPFHKLDKDTRARDARARGNR